MFCSCTARAGAARILAQMEAAIADCADGQITTGHGIYVNREGDRNVYRLAMEADAARVTRDQAIDIIASNL